MTISRTVVLRTALAAGGIAAVATYLLTQLEGAGEVSRWLEAPLSIGVILASIPFGGLHDNPAGWAVIGLAMLINAGLWGCIVASLLLFAVRVRKRLRQPR